MCASQLYGHRAKTSGVAITCALMCYSLSLQVARHLASSYGDQAPEIAKFSSMTGRRWPVIGRRLVADFPYIEAEVKYAIHKEYARTAVDVIGRRTRLAFQNVQAAHEALPRVVEIMQKELKWSKKEKEVRSSIGRRSLVDRERSWLLLFPYAIIVCLFESCDMPQFPASFAFLSGSNCCSRAVP